MTPLIQTVYLKENLEEFDVRCLVATVGDDGTLKVWPIQPPDSGDGKIWFRVDQIRSIEPVEVTP